MEGIGGEYELASCVFQLLRCVYYVTRGFAASLHVVPRYPRVPRRDDLIGWPLDTRIIRPIHGRDPSFDRPAAGCSGGPPRRHAAKQRRDWARTGLLGFFQWTALRHCNRDGYQVLKWQCQLVLLPRQFSPSTRLAVNHTPHICLADRNGSTRRWSRQQHRRLPGRRSTSRPS